MRASEMMGASGMASVLTPMRREHAMNSSAAAPSAGTMLKIKGVAAVDPSTAPSMSESPSPHSPPMRRTAAPSAQVRPMPAAVSAAPAGVGQKAATDEAAARVEDALAADDYAAALAALAALRAPIDAFFEDVLIMDDDLALRENRLRLLNRFVAVFAHVADFGKMAKGAK